MPNGDLCMGDSEQAKKTWKLTTKHSMNPDTVHKQAVEAVRRRGGDVNCRNTVLGDYIIQFGGYHGQTFKWVTILVIF
jgi:hypothetical protein